MGTLTWTYSNGVFTTVIDDGKPVTAQGASPIFIQAKYTQKNSASSQAYTDEDKVIWNGYTNGNACYVRVRDSAYSDVTAFVTAMSGVYLVYELATPTTETADPFTSTQVIDLDGTEEYVDTRTVAIPVGHESAYANICPIEGRTGTEVQRTGKNLLPCPANGTQTSGGITLTVTDGVYTVTGTSSSEVRINFLCEEFVIPQGGDINSLYLFNDLTSSTYFELLNENTVVETWFLNPKDRNNVTYNVMAGKTVNRLGVRVSSNSTVNATFKPAIFSKTLTNPTFEPYSKDTASVSFGQTVYGGQVDFVTGKCRVKYKIIDCGDITWTADSVDGMFRFTDNDAKYHGDILSSHFKSSKHNKADMEDGEAAVTNSQELPLVRVYSTKYSGYSAADFKTAMDGVQLVYELATPTEVQLTPAQLTLLQGTNILTADGTINLTYLGSMASNVQSEIDEFESGLNNVIGSIAFIENATAKTSHAVGEYIILGGIFCKVIARISSGETLSFGTNIQATTIGAELRAIWEEISV